MSTDLKVTAPDAMRFDARYRAKTDGLRASIKKLTAALLDHESDISLRGRARKREDSIKFEAAVQALACNLILLAATGSNAGLAVPRSHSFIWGGAGTNPVYGQHFLVAIGLMSSLGLIHEGKRGYRVSNLRKMPSLIWPEEALAAFLPLTPPDWRSIEEIDDPNVIILRSRKIDGQAAGLPFEETKRTKQYSRQMRRINANLRKANIDIFGLGDTLALDRDGHIVAPYRRSLYRVFNNASWREGGRLAGGFWMSMRRHDRHLIRIDDEEIATPDYRQLFPRMAYVRAGVLESDDSEDLYDIAGDRSSRDGWKKLVNAMLFSERPLKAWPEGTQQEFPTGTKLSEARELILQRHARIAHLFGTGIGFQLMWQESEMLIEVVTNLAAMGVTALPLHDAVVVAKSKADLAADLMQASFTSRTGSRCAIVSR